MPRNDHKKVIQQLSEAYQNVYKEDTGKRYQVLSIGGEHGQNSYVEAEFDDLNEVEMHLASQLDRHGIDIDDWKQGDFAGDLRTPSMWKREEGSGHLYLPIQGADGDDVYEVVDTHSDTIDDFNKEENRREFAKMDFDEYNTAYGKVPPVEDAEHVFKNTEAGYEREDFKHKYSERVRAVNDAMKALVKFENNIKHEDLDVEALADAHDQLSRALHWLVDEKAVEYIIGGRATERAAAGSRPEPF